MKLGEKLDDRPSGPLLVTGIGPTFDGWSHTVLEDSSGVKYIKRASSKMGDFTTEYYAYEDTTEASGTDSHP